MRESFFIKKNQTKWSNFEEYLHKQTSLAPSQLSDLYMEISDDLNYARTFFPEGKVVSYLNHLASQYHREVYSDKKMGVKDVVNFYVRDFPLMFYRYLPQLGVSVLVFGLFVLMGAYSAETDTSFVRSILGDAYVNQTLSNIESGDPMAVYKKMNQVDMFLGITVNNIRVAIMAFVAGMFLGVGTLLVLMYNGVMLGSFQYFFPRTVTSMGVGPNVLDKWHDLHFRHSDRRLCRSGVGKWHSISGQSQSLLFLPSRHEGWFEDSSQHHSLLCDCSFFGGVCHPTD